MFVTIGYSQVNIQQVVAVDDISGALRLRMSDGNSYVARTPEEIAAVKAAVEATKPIQLEPIAAKRSTTRR